MEDSTNPTNEQQLSSAFKAAAYSVTQLYKESLNQNKRAYHQGYLACVNDLMVLLNIHPHDLERSASSDLVIHSKDIVDFLKARLQDDLNYNVPGNQSHTRTHSTTIPTAQDSSELLQPSSSSLHSYHQPHHHHHHHHTNPQVPNSAIPSTLPLASPPISSQTAPTLAASPSSNSEKLTCEFSFRPPQSHRQIPHTLPTRQNSGLFQPYSTFDPSSQPMTSDGLKRRIPGSSFDQFYSIDSTSSHHHQPMDCNTAYPHSLASPISGHLEHEYSPPYKRGKVMPMQEDD